MRGYRDAADANACARHQYEKADVEMNRVYGQLMSELAGEDDKNQRKLRQAQMLSLKYRDSNCESEASIYEGGSIRPAIYSHCLASITQERTRRLKASSLRPKCRPLCLVLCTLCSSLCFTKL
ncbi:MAG: lysozyme inhibitor LprI family protein [Pyrinomonadaceae bacterium]